MPISAASVKPDDGKKKPQPVTIFLSQEVLKEVSAIAQMKGVSVAQIARLGLSLAILYVKETEAGNSLVVTSKEGEPLKQVVIP